MTLSHIDANGNAHMVDVGQKEATWRTAVAGARVTMKPETLELIARGEISKGDVFACARIAGIMAAKRTPELIPLCHPIPLSNVTVDIRAVAPDTVALTATAQALYVTGVEMEALCAVSVAALTIYDMCKAVDRGMQITDVQLMEKSGGKSGDYRRDASHD